MFQSGFQGQSGFQNSNLERLVVRPRGTAEIAEHITEVRRETASVLVISTVLRSVDEFSPYLPVSVNSNAADSRIETTLRVCVPTFVDNGRVSCGFFPTFPSKAPFGPGRKVPVRCQASGGQESGL